MRAFIVLCLVATACAQSGYNYGVSGGAIGGGFASGATGGSSSFGSGASFGGSGSSFGASGFGSSAASLGASGAAFGGSGSSGFQGAVQGELEKEFYTFTADEQDFNEPAASNQIANSVKQGLRVIFIKGPENNGLENAALALAKHSNEQKTAIYVLSKQTDLSGLANKLSTETSNVNSKPEVHFVKYRTQEDAVNAQRAIQAQYDALGGKTQHFDGGVAPSLNFASAGSVGATGGSFGSTGGSFGATGGSFGATGGHSSFGASAAHHGSFAGATSASYLPANVHRRV
ncbi:uncharacterized protein LOC142233763 [Haematobia irritans]|uniref:uncharacterized protein LOC142233763 n=1 Tax=Haematobia irritans TaxID=7368 RepID=UPI003F4F6720